MVCLGPVNTGQLRLQRQQSRFYDNVIESRARSPNEKKHTNLSTVLINIQFAVNAQSHNAHEFGFCALMEGDRGSKRERERLRESKRKRLEERDSESCKDMHHHILFGD